MTTKISAFSRAYHYEENKIRIYSDSIAKKLIMNQEYDDISNHMGEGITFLNSTLEGKKEEALRWIVENILGPTPLLRVAFAVKAVEEAVRFGAK